MEEDYLLLGGDEDTDMAEIAAAYKKQAGQQNQELEAFQICQICIEKFDNTTRPRVSQHPEIRQLKIISLSLSFVAL